MTWTTRFSPCRRWRYTLVRPNLGGSRGLIVWCGHNPSNANEEKDDPTISREIGFSTRWGFSDMLKVNTCAWVDSDPNGLLAPEDPVGPENDELLIRAASEATLFVAAWGALAAASKRQVVRDRPYNLLQKLAQVCDVYTLGLTKEGYPIHPLARGKSRVPDSATPILWKPKATSVRERFQDFAAKGAS